MRDIFDHEMKTYVLANLVCLSSVLWAGAVRAEHSPPDTRSWDEVIQNFATPAAQSANDGHWDGKRLLDLDSQMATTYLLSCLAESKPCGIRLKAVGALGWNGVTNGIPPLSSLALDEKEPECLREAALNPGLRYMMDDSTLKAAIPLASHDNSIIRTAAYWALSGNGSTQAVRELEIALQREAPKRKEVVIYALNYSGNSLAGKVVRDQYVAGNLPNDERTLRSFVICMNTYRRADARDAMKPLTTSTDNLTALWALQYFGNFPDNEVAEVLIRFIEERGYGVQLYDTAKSLLNSDKVSAHHKQMLRAFEKEGKVKPPEPPQI